MFLNSEREVKAEKGWNKEKLPTLLNGSGFLVPLI